MFAKAEIIRIETTPVNTPRTRLFLVFMFIPTVEIMLNINQSKGVFFVAFKSII